MRKLNIPIHWALTGLVLFAAVGLRVWDPEPVARLRLSVFDAYQRFAPRAPDLAQPVRVVDIDEASLAKLGQWPWPRVRLAAIVDRLTAAGASSVALDVILAEPDRFSPGELARQFASLPELKPLAEGAVHLPDNDEVLAVALSRLPSVLGVSGETKPTGWKLEKPRAAIAFAGDDPQEFVPRFTDGAGPLPVLSAKASAVGAVNWLPAQDQIVRRVPLLVSIGGTLYPSLALEQFRLAKRDSTILVRASGAHGVSAFGQRSGIENVRTGGSEFPAEADGQMWLAFSRFDQSRYIPAHAVLDGSVDAKELAGRHVIIGASATGLLDLRATPLDTSVPGVEIHAQALEQMLAGVHLVRPAWATGAEIMVLTLTGTLLAWLIGRSGPLVAAGIGAAAISAVIAASWSAFQGSGFLLDPVYPAIALTLLYLTISLASFIRTEAERTRVRQAFSHYLAEPLVAELARDPGKLKLGGEMREVTLLFADVRGFSKLSEGMSAEELVRFMNALFTPLTGAIIEHKGTVDKFMGDAVMAFWNAPLTDPDHARNAARAALSMLVRLETLNREREAEATSRGLPFAPVRIGIGLNTGTCAVGNVGSPGRFDYSVIGEGVNVASRLQELTKIYATPIIAGESTVRAAEGLAFLEIDTITPRGKTRSERIYALLGDERIAQSHEFRDFSMAHAALVFAIATEDKDAARTRLAAAERLDWAPGRALLDLCAKRAGSLVG